MVTDAGRRGRGCGNGWASRTTAHTAFGVSTLTTATLRAFVFSCSLGLAVPRTAAQDPPPPGEQPVQEIPIPTEQGAGPIMDISLQDAMRLGLRNNTTLRSAEIVPQQAQQNLVLAEAFFEPELFADFGYLSSRTPTLNVFQPALERERVDGNFGWRQRVITGGLLSLAFNAARLNQASSIPGFPETQYSTELLLSYTQPLLRGAWTDYNLQNVDIARTDLRASEFDYNRVVQDTLLAVVEAYWELVFARENYRVVVQALEVAQEQLRITNERIRVQELAERDRVSDEAEVARQEENRIVALNNIRGREDILRRLMFDDQEGGIWNRVLRPTSTAEISPAVRELDWRSPARVARLNRPDLRVLQLNVTVAEVQLMAAERDLLPQLDLVSTYGNEGVDSTFASGLSGTTGLDNPDWSLRLEFSVPIGNSAAIAAHNNAALELERTKRVLYGAETDVDLEVRDVVRQLHSLSQSIRAAQESVRLAEDTLETEVIKLGVGNSTRFEVQSRNQELLQARSRLLRNQLDYRIARIRLLHVQGLLDDPEDAGEADRDL